MRSWIGFLIGAMVMNSSLYAEVHCAGRALSSAYQDSKAISLVRAAVRGDVRSVQSLVQSGADVNHLEPGAVPPLLWTICADSVEGFEALLKAGANPNLGGTGEGEGDGKGHGLMEDGSIIYAGWSATLMAAGTARSEFLKLALQHGGDLNAQKGPRGEHRPLLLASYFGLFENVKTLVGKGADINAHHDQYRGYTASELAITAGGRFDIAVWLLEHGYSYDLAALGRCAEARYGSFGSPQQTWKERLIEMLHAKGVIFPASPNLIKAIKTRVIPREDVQDLIYGRRDPTKYPLR
jgi:ankyrin repeat protein